MNISIRKETESDIPHIYDVTVSAFLNAPHSDHTEQFIVNALRDEGMLSISLIAENDIGIVGHVALSPVSISDNSKDWYGLGPISVLPEYQNRGIGSALMNAAIEALKDIKAQGCVLLGDFNYYARFDFKPLEGLILPDVPAEYFQALVLSGKSPQGIVAYDKSFFATS